MNDKSTLEVAAKLESLASLSNYIVDAARKACLDDHAVWEVQLAVDEAATNIIHHAYAEQQSVGLLMVETEQSDDYFTVTLRDKGKVFDPSNVPEPDLESPLEQRKTGGLGLFLMRKLMDDVQFKREGDINVLRMLKHLPPAGLRYVSLSGRVDAAAAPVVQQTIRHAVDHGGRLIVADLAQVTFLSSSGLRALLMMNRELVRRSGALHLCCLQPQVAEVFHLTGFDQIFALFATRREAANAFATA